MFDKEVIWPALMIARSPSAFELYTLTQYTAQSHTNPAIQEAEGCMVSSLEICEPAAHYRVELADYCRQTVAVRALGQISC